MAAAGVELAAHQVQVSLLDRRALLNGMADFCAPKNIALLPYGVVAGGWLSDRCVLCAVCVRVLRGVAGAAAAALRSDAPPSFGHMPIHTWRSTHAACVEHTHIHLKHTHTHTRPFLNTHTHTTHTP